MDSIDKKIINLLIQDFHQSSEKIAIQLGVSSSTVRRRIKKLIKDKILYTVAVADAAKLGYSLRTVITFNVDHEHLGLVLQGLSSYPEIKWVSATTGRFDIIAIGWFSSSDALYNFMKNEVSKLEGIKNTETFVCLYVEKELGHQLPRV